MKKNLLLTAALLVAMIFYLPALATKRLVPSQYSTIQGGINASSNGDTVLVDPGTYNEHLNLNGKNIKLFSKYLTTSDTAYISSTIIDGSNSGSVLTMINGESSSCQVCGFTIQNGNATGNAADGKGGGIVCMYSSPTILNCKIRNNNAPSGGGGIYTGASNSIIKFCTIEQNVSANGGGGFMTQGDANITSLCNCIITYNVNSTSNTFNCGGGGAYLYHSGKLENCLIIHNSVPNSPVGGGGVCCDANNNSIFITGCTITHNTALNWGGTSHVGTDGAYRNCIIWGNTDNSGNTSNYNGGTLVYCCTTPLLSGTGNISSDPSFINATSHNFRLSTGSPCINTGNNGYATETVDLDGNARITGGTIDMGCYEASSSSPQVLSIVSHVPAANANNIDPASNMTITFSESMDQTTLTNANIRIIGSQSGLHPCSITYDDGPHKVTLDPNSDWRTGEIVEVVVTKQVKSSGGVTLSQPCIWTFTVKVSSPSVNFTSSQILSSPGNAIGAVLSDLDNDGDLDAIVTHHNAGDADILRNDGQGVYTKVLTLTGNGLSYATYCAATGDFDNDGDMDIAIPSRFQSKVCLWRNDGNLSFTALQSLGVHSEPMFIDMADLNGDSYTDMVVDCNSGSSFYYDVLINDKTGHFSLGQGISVPARQHTPCLGDFDGDGDIDIIGGGQNQQTLYFMQNNGAGTFTLSIQPVNGGFAKCGDFDNDGDLDLIVASSDYQHLQVLFNNGTGSFTAGSYISGSGNYQYKVVRDFNADGLPDFAILNTSLSIDIYLNNGAGNFVLGSSIVPASIGDSQWLDAGDFDNDGDMDFVRPNGNDNLVTFYKSELPPFYWLGMTDDWFTPSNWGSGTIPGSSDDVIIPANPAGGQMPVISSSTPAECRNMNINSNALLTIGAGKTMNCHGTGNINGGLDCYGVLDICTGGVLNTNSHLKLYNNASLMHGEGTPGGGGTVNGNVLIKRTGGTGAVQNFWSAPVSNANTVAFGTNQVWWFNPETAHAANGFQDGWVHSPQSSMVVTRGYTVIDGGAVTFSGTVNDGTCDFYVKDFGPTGNDGCNLIGNPYPSSISVDDFLNNPYNMSALGEVAVYLWTDDQSGGTGYSNGPADFTTINLLGIIDPTGGGNPIANPDKIIGSCQGFEVLADGGASTQLQMQFTNSMRRSQNDVFYKNTEEIFPSVKLAVELNDSVYNEIIVGFKEDATDGFDKKYDARKMSGNDYIAFYSKIDNRNYCIQGLPPGNNADKPVRLGLYAGVTGEYTMKVVYEKNFSSGTDILLEDRETGTWTTLSENTEYKFTVANSGVFDDRFLLHFNTVNVPDHDIGKLKVFGAEGKIIVENPENRQGTVEVFDAIGKVLASQTLGPGNSVMTVNSPTAYVLARITTQGSVVTRKIFFR